VGGLRTFRATSAIQTRPRQRQHSHVPGSRPAAVLCLKKLKTTTYNLETYAAGWGMARTSVGEWYAFRGNARPAL